jgi:hypothetical protein
VALFASLIEHPTTLLVQAGGVLGLSLSLGFTSNLINLIILKSIHSTLGNLVGYIYVVHALVHSCKHLKFSSFMQFTSSIVDWTK